MSGYIPNTEAQQKEMLAEIGLRDFEQLFADIPAGLRLQERLSLPPPLSETELLKRARSLAAGNCNTDDYACFLGAGAYDHYIPSVISHLVSRQEFYTAYTPYQPEISQGTLQAIFEYQSMICLLTGMEVANASMYDGASALAEAAMMACTATRRKKVLLSQGVNPESSGVVSTYARFRDYAVEPFGLTDGSADIDDIRAKITKDTAAVILQTPNFFGIVEDIGKIAELAYQNGALVIVSCDPIALALLKAPGNLGADIVVGEGQSLGNALNFGGPYIGFFATSKELMRKMPGRIAGMTVDHDGRRGYVLTLQAREQHIRREKATSNICSNEALNALTAVIYLSVLGKEGLREVATQCVQKAHYACEKMIETGAFQPVFKAPFFLEFALQYSGNVAQLNQKLLEHNIIGGLDLSRRYDGMQQMGLSQTSLFAVTEKRTRAEIDELAKEASL